MQLSNEEGLKQKKIFEALDKKINENAKMANESIIKMKKELLVNNETQNGNIYKTISVEINAAEKAIYQDINIIMQELTEKFEVLDKQYEEKIQRVLALQNTSQSSFERLIADINDKIKSFNIDLKGIANKNEG